MVRSMLFLVLLVFSGTSFGQSCDFELTVEFITDTLPHIESAEAKVEAVDEHLGSVSAEGECYDYLEFALLPYAIRYSAISEQYKRLSAYVSQVEGLLDGYRDNWNYGNALHDVRMAKGMKALEMGDTESAKTYLRSSIDVPRTPQINAFGTNVYLADRLLDRGCEGAVVDYLKGLDKLWGMNDGRVDLWIHQIESGKQPNFGINLIL